MKKLLCACLIICLLAPAHVAHAWSEGGHHIIVLIALSRLSPSERTKIKEILEKHPRFKEDFVPPEKLESDEEILRWQVGRAGYWPDVARKQPKYNRSKWHYELGSALVIGDASKFDVPDRPGVLPADATLETQDLYISQALPLCTKILSEKHHSDADRAIALCWVAHLVGDAHQPCHAGSLYMEKVFTEQDGDRGANRILTKQRQNMHALWDQLLGNDYSVSGVRNRLREISSDQELIKAAEAALAKEDGLSPQTWLKESRKLAVENVYTPEVMQSLEHVSRGLVDKPEELELSEAYLKNAGRIAQIRAAEAGFRLAETWRQAIKEGG